MGKTDPLNTLVDSVFLTDIGFHAIFLFYCWATYFSYFWICIIGPGFGLIKGHNARQTLSQDKAQWPYVFAVS
jgi:hypothetical protein